MPSAPRRPPSFYRKLLASFLVLAAVVTLAAGVFGSGALERLVVKQLGASLGRLARVLEPEIAQALAASPTVGAIQPLARALGQRAGARVTIVDAGGVVLGDSEQQTEAGVTAMEPHGGRSEIHEAMSTGRAASSLRYSETLRRPMLYVATPVIGSAGPAGVLRLAVPVTVVTELRHQVRRVIALSFAVGLGLALLLGAWLAQRVARPLARLTQTASAYARGGVSFSAAPASVAEVQALAEALQTMSEAIRTQFHQLTVERNQATAILESMAEGVLALDAQARVLLLNPSAATLLGVSAVQAAGRSLYEAVRNPDLQAMVRMALEDGQRSSRELRVLQPGERMLRVHAVPCRADAASAEAPQPSAVLVLQDVTEHHRYEQLRKEFVANVSHELKSPLTSIRGLTETLLDGAVEDPNHNRRFLRLIDEDAARLSRLIDDLLALSEIESQAVPLRLAAVELNSLVESVLQPLQPRITPRRLRLSVEVPAGLTVRADADRLRQVLTNLIDNAIKYNREGGALTISARPQEGWVEVSVADTGVGIPPADLPRIFERFYRVDKARSRELGGTGLGLAIVKHIAEAHGGRVWVQSQPERGSTFSFTIPLAT